MGKVSVIDVREKKGREKIVTITAYDYSMARLFDPYADIVLVGDSVGMVFGGLPHTLAVTLDDMIYHARAVARGLSHAHLVVDLPFMTYQVSPRQALRNAGRLLSEGGAESVKLEGGVAMAETVRLLVSAGIPVMGHIGLTPQSVHAMGGFRVQGKTEAARHALVQDAMALEDAGAYAVVLEGIPAALAQTITAEVKIPTIGIGAGRHCDGQVLVSTDLLGLNLDFQPKFVKRYAHLENAVREAVQQYALEVREGTFPDESHSF